MWHRKQIPATALEKLRISAMMKAGCMLSMYRRERGLLVPERGKIECHHIVRGPKRLGNLYTVSLNIWYHQRVPTYPARDVAHARELYGASIKDSMRVFRESHGIDDLELWVWGQERLGMSAELPVSKIYKAPVTEADRLA